MRQQRCLIQTKSLTRPLTSNRSEITLSMCKILL
uniref:VE19 n=1 Tax=Enterococcus faecalis TaxID=1351 RepID=C4P4J6_ENTFL|nr:VE19 [Enterococcus faecalis]